MGRRALVHAWGEAAGEQNQRATHAKHVTWLLNRYSSNNQIMGGCVPSKVE